MGQRRQPPGGREAWRFARLRARPAAGKRGCMGANPLAWRDEMGRILEEHAELHQATQSYLAGVRNQLPVGQLVESMQGMIDLLGRHFDNEEQLMRRAGYPELHAHHLLHETCLQQFRAELSELSLGQPRDYKVYQEMIRTWIIDHLRIQDRRFDAFLTDETGYVEGELKA